MNPTDPAAYDWPEPCRESLLADFAAERDRRQDDHLAELIARHP